MTDSTTPKDTDDKAGKQRKAYGAAMARLREAHRDEFNVFMGEEAKTLGIDWKPKATPAQKAAQQLQALLAEHPELRSEFGLPPEADVQPGTEPSDEDAAMYGTPEPDTRSHG